MTWPVSPLLFENMDFPNPLDSPPFNLLPTLNYPTLPTGNSMVLISLRKWILRDKNKSWYGENFSPYRNGLV